MSTKASWQGKSIRTTICLDRRLERWARKQMKAEGYNNNFSAFMCDIVRQQMRRNKRNGKHARN